jgi:hypothetical protein
MAPLPKGRTNNPNGRPKIGETARVLFTTRLAPATVEAIVSEAARREISRGALLDELVAKAILRKRKP